VVSSDSSRGELGGYSPPSILKLAPPIAHIALPIALPKWKMPHLLNEYAKTKK